MVSLSDLINGPKMFEDTFGSTWGPRWWRLFFSLAILAAAAFFLTEIGGLGKNVYSSVAELLKTTPEKQPQSQTTPQVTPLVIPQVAPASPPAPTQQAIRINTEKTVEDILGFCIPHTQLQCDVFLAAEKGKWITITGVVRNVYSTGQIIFFVGEQKRDVSCVFKDKSALGAYVQNDTIRAIGRIDRVMVFALLLDDCELQ